MSGTSLRLFIKTLTDLLFPPKCLLCNEIDPRSAYPFLCMSCFEGFKATGQSLFSQSLDGKVYYDSLRSAGVYEGKLEEAIKAYKYGKRRFLAKPLSGFLINSLQNHLSGLNIDIIIPVPLHTKRLRQRGFHHSYLIAREISKKMGKKTDYRNFIKYKDSTPQVQLKLAERRSAPCGTFCMKQNGIFKDKSILLVDDVLTSGSTLNECSKVLKNESQASQVHCITVAKTL